MGDGCQERSVDVFVSGLSVKGPWRLGGPGDAGGIRCFQPCFQLNGQDWAAFPYDHDTF